MSSGVPAALAAPPRSSGWADTEVSVVLRRGAGGVVRVDGVLCRAPVWFRWDPSTSTLWLVGSGASPVGDDRIRVHVDVGAGVVAAVRSVAATVVYAGRGPGTTWDTEIHVGDGARLDWRPQSVILTGPARHQATTALHASSGADVTLDEVVVLGRFGEPSGQLRSTLAVTIDGVAALRTSIDTSVPGWSGPAGVDGASVVANRLRVAGTSLADPPPAPERVGRATLLSPAPACRLGVALGDDVTEARSSLDRVLPA